MSLEFKCNVRAYVTKPSSSIFVVPWTVACKTVLHQRFFCPEITCAELASPPMLLNTLSCLGVKKSRLHTMGRPQFHQMHRSKQTPILCAMNSLGLNLFTILHFSGVISSYLHRRNLLLFSDNSVTLHLLLGLLDRCHLYYFASQSGIVLLNASAKNELGEEQGRKEGGRE